LSCRESLHTHPTNVTVTALAAAFSSRRYSR